MPFYHSLLTGLMALLVIGSIVPLPASAQPPAASAKAPAAFGQPPAFDPAAWVPDGPVNAIQGDPASGITYLGGDFGSVNPYTGHLLAASLTGAQNAPPPGFPALDGPVYAIAGSPSAGWYVGGDFDASAGLTRRHLLHLNPDLSLDLAWAPDVDGPVYAIRLETSLTGTWIYIGGSFQNVNGQPRANLAALDAVGATRPWTPNPDGPVRALLAQKINSTLFVGGAFQHIGSQAVNALGVVELTGPGNPTGWRPNPGLDDLAEVDALQLLSNSSGYNLQLLAGGKFTIPLEGGGQVSNLAGFFWDSGLLNKNLDFRANGPVRALLARNETSLNGTSAPVLYIGGAFTQVSGEPAAGLARIFMNDPTLTPDAAYQFDLDGAVYTIAQAGSEQIIGGDFTRVRGSDQPGLFRTWYNPGETRFEVVDWSPRIQVRNNAVRAAALAGTHVLAGGDFFSAGGYRRSNLAALDPDGQALPGWDVAVDGPVRALALSDGALFFGGKFTSIESQGVQKACPNAGGAGAVDTAGTVVTGGAAGPAGGLLDWCPAPDGPVNALAAVQNAQGATALALGGEFLHVRDPLAGMLERPRLALIEAPGGSVQALNPAPDETVRALGAQGQALFAAGSFTQAGGQPLPYAFGIDLSGGGEPYGLAAAAPAARLALSGQEVYLAEDSLDPLDPLQGRLEIFNRLAPGPALGDLAEFRAWLPALSADWRWVYLGGMVRAGDGNAAPFLAVFDTFNRSMTWLPAPLPAREVKLSGARAIQVSAGRLWAGGDFRGSENLEHPHLLVMRAPEAHFFLPLVGK